MNKAHQAAAHRGIHHILAQPFHGIDLLQTLDPLRFSFTFGLYDIPEKLESLADELS